MSNGGKTQNPGRISTIVATAAAAVAAAAVITCLVGRPFDIGCPAVVGLRRRALRDVAQRLNGNGDGREILQDRPCARKQLLYYLEILSSVLCRR